MKRMLFNATHSEELRIAVVDGQTLIDLDIDYIDSKSKKGNIYQAKITKIEPSLEAAFVDFGSERHGFLSIKDISRKYFKNSDNSTPLSQVRIQDVLSVGDNLVVQVEKEERGTKGAALTTFISLAGRYLVLLPDNPRGGGISRQIEGSKRQELKDVMAQLDVPTEHSVIARTAGIGKAADNFQADLKYLMNLWRAIEEAANGQSGPFLIYQESSLIVRVLRDYMRDDISQILVDDEEIYRQTTKFIEDAMPNSNVAVKHYTETVPLFSRYQVEQQIEGAFERKVDLPSGGAIVIDQTEALVTIDVNSARSTRGSDIEETAYQTNIEAVRQIAKQLRVRDIGGLIVLDLIDMSSPKHRRNVETEFIESLRSDRARVRVGRISKFGLLEMSRQRLRSSIEEASHDVCPRCNGRGYVRNVMSTGLSILRVLEEDALKENTELLHAHLPIEIATFLLNEKRHEINMIEQRFATRVVVVPNKSLQTPDYRIMRFKASDADKNDGVLSYNLQYPDQVNEVFNFVGGWSTAQRAAVDHSDIDTRANGQSANQEQGSLIGKVLKTVFGSRSDTAETEPAPEPAPTEASKPARKRKPAQRKTTRSGNESQARGNGRRRSGSRSSTESKAKDNQPRRSRSSSRGRPAKDGNSADPAAKAPAKRNQGSSRSGNRRRGPRKPANTAATEATASASESSGNSEKQAPPRQDQN